MQFWSWLLGVAVFIAAVPGLAWLSAWLYVYTEPLDWPLDPTAVRRHALAGGIFGLILAIVGIAWLNTLVGPSTW